MSSLEEENWTVTFKDPKGLVVAPTNVRVEIIPDSEKEIMKLSVMNVGIKEPIILNENNEIVSGSLRWSAALSAGLEKVPCIIKKFRDKFEERVTCMLQDDLHHPITERARFLFVKKSIEEDGMTIADVAKALGKTEQTIRQWTKYEEYPEQIEDKPELKQTFLEAPRKKKIAIRSITNTKQFKEDPEKAIKLVEIVNDTTLSTLDAIRKASLAGVSVDVEFQKWLNNQDTTLLETKIPKRLDLLFKDKLKKDNRDITRTIIDLIDLYVKGKVEIK